MEIVIRVSLFYALEKIYNNITAVIPHPNCRSNAITTGNSSPAYEEPTFSYADQSYSNADKTNLFHVFLISTCMIFVVTVRQGMLRTIKSISPIMLLLGSLDYFYDCTITLNKHSAKMLHLTAFVTLCYPLYRQLGLEYNRRQFKTLKWLIPLTLLFWSFDYVRDCNVVTISSYSLSALRIFTYLMVSYSLHLTQREEPNRLVETAEFFLLLTFDLGNAEFQYLKFWWLISLLRTILPRSATNLKKIYFLILFICFVIELPTLNCAWWDFQSWEEIYRMETVTIARVSLAFEIWPYLNKLIFETVQHELLRVPDFELGTAVLESMTRHEFFAIDSHLLNNENRWNVLQICFIINFGELLVNFSALAFFILAFGNRRKKLLVNTLIVSSLTVSSAFLMLADSLWTFNFNAHVFVVVCLAIFVILFNLITILRCAVVKMERFKKSVERLHWVRLLECFMFLIHCFFFISLSIGWFWIAVSEEFVGLLIYENGRLFMCEAIDYIGENIVYIKLFVKAKIFIYFISESKAKVLRELNDVCPVCREEMLSACVTPCNHHYHEHCLLSCLYDSNKCPLCRSPLFILS